MLFLFSRWQHDAVFQRRLLVLLTVLICLSHVLGILFTTGLNGRMLQGDAGAYFAYLPSVILDRDLDLRNQFEVLNVEKEGPRPFGGTDDLAANLFPIGPAICWLPGYLVGLFFEWWLRLGGLSTRPFGYGSGAVLATAVWSILLAGIGVESTRRLAKQTLGIEHALSSSMMIWLGTPALYYTLISPLYSHSVAWCVAALTIWAAWNARGKPVRWGAVGLLSGLLLAVRLQDAPLLFIPLALLVSTPGRRGRSSVTWLAGIICGFLPQALTSLLLNSSLLPADPTSLQTPALSTLKAILLSTEYLGWISWTPIVLPSILGLGFLAWRSSSSRIYGLAISGIAAICVMVAIDVVHPFGAGAGTAFGGRRYVSTAPVLTLGLAAILALPTPRWQWKLILPGLVVWNLWLLMSYEWLIIFDGVYPTLQETAWHAFGLGAPN